MTDPGFPRPYPRMARPATRPEPMKVLGLGLSRTSTMSLYVALRKLGYKCYHMAEAGLDSANDSLILWHQALDAKYHGKGRKFAGAQDFDQMLWRYDAVTDIPCVLFVDEMLDAYPDAKVIITSRPVEKWLASIDRSFYAIVGWKRWPILEFLDRQHIHHHIPILKTALEVWTGTTWDDKAKLSWGYEAHYKHLRSVVKTQRREVLEFDPKDGWVPLCKFLDKDVPDESYPHVNEGGWVVGLHVFIFWIRLLIVCLGVLKYAAPLVVAYVAWWYVQR